MRLHKEGFWFIIVLIIILFGINLFLYSFLSIVLSVLILLFFARFFRKPKRTAIFQPHDLIASADGKVVVIEKVVEDEYFHDVRIQVSIFMSVWDVHINWFPISGMINYKKYHPGKYLVAWHPKSSTENEHISVVVQTDSGNEILVRQIAGAVARRIVSYANEGARALQGDEMGFIKFGSRVDLFLPLNSEILINLNQKVKGHQTVIARINQIS